MFYSLRLAKANMGEYATGNPRSSFGGIIVNVFDTTRSPQGSSSGSATAVSANLVTCAIGEETGAETFWHHFLDLKTDICQDRLGEKHKTR